jgi:hypothetical protein
MEKGNTLFQRNSGRRDNHSLNPYVRNSVPDVFVFKNIFERRNTMKTKKTLAVFFGALLLGTVRIGKVDITITPLLLPAEKE